VSRFRVRDGFEKCGGPTPLPSSSGGRWAPSIVIYPHFISRKYPHWLVPAGSGNDFAKSLGIHNVETGTAGVGSSFCTEGHNVQGD